MGAPRQLYGNQASLKGSRLFQGIAVFEKLSWFSLGCFVLLFGACNIVPPERTLVCSDDVECPDDWSCVGGYCSSSGPEPEPDAGEPDAGEPPPLPSQREGEACSTDLEKACSEADRREQLVCLDGQWRSVGSCAGATHCDSREGETRGTCQPIAEACLGKDPGAVVCENGARERCSADLLQVEAYACGENQHCEGDSDVSCVCDAGFDATAAGGCAKDACPDGYAREGEDCVDIDDCAPELDRCPHRACKNSEGSYACGACDAGYTESAGACVDIDECQANTCGEQRVCTNSPGSFSCGECQRGYELQGEACTDSDECAAGSCGANRACENTPGSFVCGACASGYADESGACVEVDECAAGACGPNRACENSPGSYSCGACSGGFVLSGELCLDIDECAQGACGEHRMCTNSEGSYACGGCNGGFADDGTACSDIDECAAGSCVNRPCTNTPGSYSCGDCYNGYQLDDSGQCVDINECATRACGLDVCVNYEGGYECIPRTCPRCEIPF
jgi:hypothetical protein